MSWKAFIKNKLLFMTKKKDNLEIKGLCPLFQVFDMNMSLRFYCDVIGFEIVETAEDAGDISWALLERDGMQLMLNTAYETADRPATPGHERVKTHADTCIYFGCPDVDAAYRHILAKGVTLKEPSITSYGMKQLYLLDPDGYSLCFQWPVK